jgi:transglutaminase-like putative cysteine protease
MPVTDRAVAGDRRRLLDGAATLGLAAYSFVAGLGYVRVFGDWGFVVDVAIVVVVGHGLSLLLRLSPVGAMTSTALVCGAVVWTVAWRAYPVTFAAVVPTAQTWDVAWADLGLVGDQFPTAVAPVAYIGGWSLLALIGTGVVVVASDTLAFRGHAGGAALVPGVVLFVFVAAVGAERHRIGVTLALVVTGFVAASLLRIRSTPTPRTLLGRYRHPLAITLRAAIPAATVVALGAWAGGSRLPGAGADALIDTGNNAGRGPDVGNPLVDIRALLVTQTNTELFVVNATEADYWRTTALAVFDGNTWKHSERAADQLAGLLPEGPTGFSENTQTITIRGLNGDVVPAAAEPVARAGDGLSWHAETSTLRFDRPLVRGDRFEVTSARPTLTPQRLRTSGSSNPPDPIYLALPANFPTSVTEQARTVTSGATTTYDAMVALQNWFLNNFKYSTEVPQGEGNSAIEAFLRQRIGFCVHFAGTFAAMARALGVPSRVATGFTHGLAQPDASRLVLGRHAHVWPEVWFDDIGWVRFEPTSGRGAPGDQAHTGLPPDQDESAPTPHTDRTDTAAAPAATAPTVTDPRVAQPRLRLEDLHGGAIPPAPPVDTFVGPVPGPGPRWDLIAAAFASATGLVALPAIVRRWRRRHPHGDAAQQTLDLWRRAFDAVAATGIPIDPSLSPLEQAQAAAARLPPAARPLNSLAAIATVATYAPPHELTLLAQTAASNKSGPRRWCRQVEHIASSSTTAAGRLRRHLTVWK